MSREIRFRAWNKYEKEMYSDWDECKDWTVNESFANSEFIIEQYTGIKDKNGKEIFEGDIVKVVRHHYAGTEVYDEREDEVVFARGAFTVGEDGWYFWDYASGSTDDKVEVIGNIHESD